MLLFFAMNLDTTPDLNRGRLFLIDDINGIIGRWVATSSTSNKQGIGDWNHRGGVIPPTYDLYCPVSFYYVAVNPVDLKHVKGVEGNGYPITPFEVKTKNGNSRSDLLIHRDANVPGSMGCIVLPDGEFSDFEKTFTKKRVGEDRVKLLVGYVY